MQKTLLVPMILATALATGPQSAVAQNYPWCRINEQSGAMGCTYVSREQCLQSIGGNIGYCVANPASTSPPAPVRGPRRPNG